MRNDLNSRPQSLARNDLNLAGMEGVSYQSEQNLAQAVTTGTFIGRQNNLDQIRHKARAVRLPHSRCLCCL
jgi:hypothetical protein